MDALFDDQQPRLVLDRVINLHFPELVECCLCHGLLLHPVACGTCEKPNCSACIQKLLATKSELVCPHGCPSYIEYPCPKGISFVLSSLNILCLYKPNGCTEILSYDKLEEHEKECEYQLFTCTGCQQGITKKDYDEHISQCQLVSITCEQCSTSYKRRDTDLHTPTECLRIQLHEQISKIQQLEIKEYEQQRTIDLMERKINEYENFWTGFFKTTNQIR